MTREPQWYTHRTYSRLRVFGIELRPGDVIQDGDVYESEQLGWAATNLPGLGITVHGASRYVRPYPEPRWFSLPDRQLHGRRLVFRDQVLPGDVLLVGRESGLVARPGDERLLKPDQYVRPLPPPSGSIVSGIIESVE